MIHCKLPFQSVLKMYACIRVTHLSVHHQHVTVIITRAEYLTSDGIHGTLDLVHNGIGLGDDFIIPWDT